MIVVSAQDWPRALRELKAVMRVCEDGEVHYISELNGEEVCYRRSKLVIGETKESINKTFE